MININNKINNNLKSNKLKIKNNIKLMKIMEVKKIKL